MLPQTRLEIILTSPEKYPFFSNELSWCLVKRKNCHIPQYEHFGCYWWECFTSWDIQNGFAAGECCNIAHTERFNALKTTFTISWLDIYIEYVKSSLWYSHCISLLSLLPLSSQYHAAFASPPVLLLSLNETLLMPCRHSTLCVPPSHPTVLFFG